MPDEYSYNRPLSPGTEITYRLPCDTGTDSPPGKGRVKNAGFYVILVINDDGYEQFVFYDELLTVNEVLPHMSIDASKLYVGAIILYKLLPAENPTNPDRLWRGRVLSLHIGLPGSLDVALVENLDIGYCAGTEFVLLTQIQSIETSAPIHDVHLLKGVQSNGNG